MKTPPAPDPRLDSLKQWLRTLPAALGVEPDSLTPVSGDASFRRYFRVATSGGTRIVMDAPPPHEDCGPFVRIAQRLAGAGLTVPAIFAHETARGFLLLSDLGRQTYYEAIQAGLDPQALQRRYRAVLRDLPRIQQVSCEGLPLYDETRLLDELALFPQWYLETHLGLGPDADRQAVLQSTFERLARDAARQPRVFVHRDFHSPNLMINEAGPDAAPGIIDFQDAVHGPLSYDIASLVMDARTTWDEPQQLDWGIRYWEAARAAGLPVPADFAEFHQQYEWMGLQRNLRILGVFARLSHRDGKHHYLGHIPRVRAYVRQVAGRYDAFHPLLRVLDQAEQIQTTDGYSF
ncbi:phosphotransferase [Castellaniella sp. GW247-6E4]|uniref:aminoglycoside phosphotransferase family protein n=1 Tax=Castellaniella sp. GW247-6E4 TaxID=3140380 RepID=UPI0033152685